MSVSSVLHLIGRKRTGRLCALVCLMFIGSLLEMLNISLVVAVCSLIMDGERFASNAFIQKLCQWSGICPGKSLVTAVLVALMCFYLFKMVYLLLENWALARFVCSVQHEISVKLYAATLRAPYAWIVKTSAADVINLLNTDTGRTGGYLNSFLQVVTEGLVLIAISIFLLFINPLMTFFVLLGVFLSLLLTRGVIRPQASRTGKARREANILRMKWLNQGVHGIKDVKATQSENFFSSHYDWADGTVADGDAANRLLTKVPRLCIETIMVVCVLLYLLLLLLAGKNVLGSLPSLSALVVAALRLLPTTSRINSNLTNMNNMKPSVESIVTALERVQARKSVAKPNSAHKEIRLTESVIVSNVTFSYEGRLEPVLENVEMEIPIGSSVGIVGPSGAGKTTLVDLLLGLLEPHKGDICVDGVNIRDCLESYQRQTAYIPQNIFLLDDTVRANVAFGTDAGTSRDEGIWAALDMAMLMEMVRKLPAGLDTPVGENGIRLSGGERQRLGIARALYRGCKLIIFDEATSALDPETEESIIGSILSLRGERTLVIISHRASAVRDCDRIYRVENGEIERIR